MQDNQIKNEVGARQKYSDVVVGRQALRGGGGNCLGLTATVQQGHPSFRMKRVFIGRHMKLDSESFFVFVVSAVQQNSIQKIKQKKEQVKSFPRTKKLEKLGVYSSCKVNQRVLDSCA